MDTLLLHYTVEPAGGQPTIGLVPILRRNDGRLFFQRAHPRLANLDQLLAVSAQLVGALHRGVMAMGARVSLRAAAGFLGEVRELGSRLATLLLPEEIIRQLTTDHRVQHLTFCYDPRLNAVPFDCLRLGREFLGFRFAVGRELLSASTAERPAPDRTAQLPLKGQFLLAPPTELTVDARSDISRQVVDFYRQWQGEGKHAAIKFESLNLAGAPTRQEMLAAFHNRDVLSIYSHHHYDEDQPQASGYALSVGQTFAAMQLLEGFPPGQLPPLLVMSLCCESGITRGWEKDWPSNNRIYGMVDAAKRIAVPHYVGTLVKMPALKTVGVFAPFHRALADGCTVGEALRQARLWFREDARDPEDGGTILGLGLTLYGDPSVALLSRSGCRVAEIHAPVCEAKIDNGLCGRAVAPQDPGYALRLCPDHYSPERCSAGHTVPPGTPLEQCGQCGNKVCPKCSGWGRSLCWEHYSYEGSEILAGVKETCPDPYGLHPGEKRSICPFDDAWQRAPTRHPKLCRDCLTEALRAGKEKA